MNIQQPNNQWIEIEATLEQIQRTNQIIAFHKGFSQPDLNALENFNALRLDFLKQLAILLQEYKIEIMLPASA